MLEKPVFYFLFFHSGNTWLPLALLILTHRSLPKSSGPLMSERFACPTRKRRLCRQRKAARGGAVEVLSLGRRRNLVLLSMTVLSTPEHKLATPGDVSATLLPWCRCHCEFIASTNQQARPANQRNVEGEHTPSGRCLIQSKPWPECSNTQFLLVCVLRASRFSWAFEKQAWMIINCSLSLNNGNSRLSQPLSSTSYLQSHGVNLYTAQGLRKRRDDWAILDLRN